MKRKSDNYREARELIFDDLRDDAFALEYLNEALNDEDKNVFLLALKDVIDARGDISDLAKKAHLSRQNIYKMFSEEGNPTLESLMNILSALGFKICLSLQPA